MRQILLQTGFFHSLSHIYNTAPALKAQGSLQKRGREDSKSRKIRKFLVRLCLMEISEATLIEVSPIWLPKDLKNYNPDRHANMEGTLFATRLCYFVDYSFLGWRSVEEKRTHRVATSDTQMWG